MSQSLDEISLIDFIDKDLDPQDSMIFDPVRRKKVRKTPEELVRQSMLLVLNKLFNIPFSRMAVERKIEVMKMLKRFDIVVYSKLGHPYILVECKSPQLQMSQNFFDQAARYNIVLKSPYLCITNGIILKAVKINFEKNQYDFVNSLPMYPF
jgi:hypothetical protein